MVPHKKKVKHKGGMLTYTEAAELLGLSYGVIVTMYRKGHKTIPKMVAYRKKLSEGKLYGRRKPNLYLTNRGEKTVFDIVDEHKYKVSAASIRATGKRWGFDHEAMWMKPQPKWSEFHRLATEADGPPRPANDDDIMACCKPDGTFSNEHRETTNQNINRLLCCTRDKGREKCKTYAIRLQMDTGIPEPCKAASGSQCPNYDGEYLSVSNNSSGRGARQFSFNGTPMT